jgi:uncharacterized Fe-S cluster-containing radical SAM superfamily protein
MTEFRKIYGVALLNKGYYHTDVLKALRKAGHELSYPALLMRLMRGTPDKDFTKALSSIIGLPHIYIHELSLVAYNNWKDKRNALRRSRRKNLVREKVTGNT